MVYRDVNQAELERNAIVMDIVMNFACDIFNLVEVRGNVLICPSEVINRPTNLSSVIKRPKAKCLS